MLWVNDDVSENGPLGHVVCLPVFEYIPVNTNCRNCGCQKRHLTDIVSSIVAVVGACCLAWQRIARILPTTVTSRSWRFREFSWKAFCVSLMTSGMPAAMKKDHCTVCYLGAPYSVCRIASYNKHYKINKGKY